jgi:hypothetical protein
MIGESEASSSCPYFYGAYSIMRPRLQVVILTDGACFSSCLAVVET